MSTELMNDPAFAKHFEAAGIVDDPTTDDAVLENNEGQEDDAPLEAAIEQIEDENPNPLIDKEPAAVKTDSSGDGANDGTQQGQAQTPPQVARPGDLVLPDGEIVKSGKERRWHERMTIAQQERDVVSQRASALEQQNAQLSTRVEAYERSLQTIGAETPQTAADAVRLYKDLTRDPVATLQTLLAEVAASGHNIQALGANIDTAAISRMIDQRLPRQDQQREQQVDEHAAAMAEAQQFYQRFPDATIHDEVLANVITQNPHLSNEQAYFEIRKAAADRGLDWSKPLGPQLAAQNQRTNPTGQQTQQVQQRAPMNPGRGTVATNVVERERNVEPAGETLDDIIKAAMRENGIQIK